MKAISFSIWGGDASFIHGAMENAILAEKFYPGWQVWIYCGADVPAQSAALLQNTPARVIQERWSKSPWEGLFWRFKPLYDATLEAFISRDCDSRLNPREAAAVQEWLASGKKLHAMRDHYEHTVPILGGMWGCRFWPEFKALLEGWDRRKDKGDDQIFLQEKVWPLLRTDCLVHDRYPSACALETPHGKFTYDPVQFFGEHNLQEFPAHEPLNPHLHGAHVGARVQPT